MNFGRNHKLMIYLFKRHSKHVIQKMKKTNKVLFLSNQIQHAFLRKTSNMSLVSIEIVMLSMELQSKRKKL